MSSKSQPMPHLDVDRRFLAWYDRLTLPWAVGTVIGAAFILVILAGGLARIIEPAVFTSLGVAYWWAVVTVTTVGYGDVVPESPGGRIVGTLLMLTGLGLIPTLTSVTVAMLVGKRSRAQQEQLERQNEEYKQTLVRIEARLERLAKEQPGPG